MKKKFKVIQIIDQPSGGGAEKICRNVKRLLIEKNIDTEIIYLKNVNNIILNQCETVYKGKFGYLGFIFFVRKKIKESIKKNYDKVIIQAHLTKSLYLFLLFTFNIKCKKIFVEHNTNYRRRRFSFLRYVERIIYKKFDKIICVSNACLDSLNKWFKNEYLIGRMSVVYNGLRLKDINKIERKFKGHFNFISIGSLTYQKGFDISIEALARLKFDNWNYVILGEGPERRKLEGLVNSYNLSNKILFEGYQDNINKYLINSDIMIIPSRWEGFGLVAVEALSYGISLVVSDVPGINEVVDNSKVCFITKSENVSDFVLSIENAMSMLQKNININEEAYAQAKKFDEQTMINNYIKIYNEV